MHLWRAEQETTIQETVALVSAALVFVRGLGNIENVGISDAGTGKHENLRNLRKVRGSQYFALFSLHPTSMWYVLSILEYHEEEKNIIANNNMTHIFQLFSYMINMLK